MKIVYLILKLAIFFTIFFIVFYILEYGFTFGTLDKLPIPFLLSGFTTIMFFKPPLKRYVLLLVSICLALMVLTYFFNLLDISKTLGNFGFSLLLVTIVLYLPQIIKEGHIERF